MIQEILQEIGLTPSEVSTYKALLSIGRTKAGEVVKQSRLYPSACYSALNSLTEKGLVSTITVGKQKQYTAADPDTLLHIIDVRREKLQAILPELKASQAQVIEEEVEFYSGEAGIRNMFFSLVEDAQPGEVMYYFDAEKHDKQEAAQRVYLPLHTRTEDKGVIVKGIHPYDTKTKGVYEGHVEVRRTTTAIPPDTTIFRNKLALVSWSEKPRGVLITSQELADQYLELWREVWQKAE